MSETMLSPEEMARELKRLAMQLQQAGRSDLLLHALGVPLLEELRIEAAKGRLSRLVITTDYRFILADYLDYSGQKVVRYRPFTGAETDPLIEYTVIRTYRSGNQLELTCRRGVDE